MSIDEFNFSDLELIHDDVLEQYFTGVLSEQKKVENTSKKNDAIMQEVIAELDYTFSKYNNDVSYKQQLDNHDQIQEFSNTLEYVTNLLFQW